MREVSELPNHHQKSGSAEPGTLLQLFASAAENHASSVAVLDGNSTLSFSELQSRAAQLARHLATLGLAPGMLAGVCVDQPFGLVTALLAVLHVGAAYVPLDATYPRERLAFMIEDARLPLILTERHLAALLPSSAARFVCLDEFEFASAECTPVAPTPRVVPEDLAYLIYTSGSTGRPKGVMIPHGAIANHMRWMQAEFPLTATDRVLQKTPISFDASVWEFYAPLFAGAQLVKARPGGHRDSRYLVETIAECGITILQLVPAMLECLVAEPGLARCTKLRRVFCGGEALAPQLCDRFFAVLPECELINLYGPTECAIDATFHRCARGEKRIPIGHAVANTQLHILAENGSPTPLGEPGELHIGGAQLARGYLNQPELTAAKFIEHDGARVYKTGDLARFLPDGEVEYLGRIDDQVKLRGHRIELGEIENVLAQHSEIRTAAVVVRTHHGAPELVAYLVSAAPLPSAELRRWLSERLPEPMLPAAFVHLEALPLMANGKVDRRALPAPAETRAATSAPARTPLERTVANTWREVIGGEALGVDDNFFEVGGNSLRLVEVHAKLIRELRRDIPIAALFQHSTVATLAQFLNAESAAPAKFADIGERARKQRQALARKQLSGGRP